MKSRLAIAIAMLLSVTVAGGCVDGETEQACASDRDCLWDRVCTSSGECVWPERNEQIPRKDVGSDAPDAVDAGPPDTDIPTDPVPDSGSTFEPIDVGTDAQPDADADVGPAVECPQARPRVRIQGGSWREMSSLTTIPLNTVEFDASESTGDITRYEWSIIERPQGSTQRLTPSNTDEYPRLFLDLAGIYRVELRVFTEEDDGATCSSAATIEIDACPCDDDVHIQLVWSTPADDDQTDTFGTDLDLHYLHENGRWNDPPWDIFWRNPVADWGPQGNVGDPSLDIDDTDGAGPENINHSGLERANYRVGAYYYSDSTLGASYATVRIYVRGQLEFELENRHLETTGTFWEAASIRGPSGGVTPIDRIHTGMPGYP